MNLKDANEPIPELSEFVQIFIKSPYIGYILFAVLIVYTTINLFKKVKIEDENLLVGFKFFRAAIKVMYAVCFTSILGGTLGGISKYNLSFTNSFLHHLPFACAQITLYLIDMVFAGTGIDVVLFVKNELKKSFVL